MNFTPESLIEIYLNGSFTEEAQREFDKLIRTDAAFAERVTQSVAQRLGPLPEGLEDRVSTGLDAKREALWLAHKPSPWGALLKISIKAAILLASAGLMYGGYQHFLAQPHPLPGTEAEVPSAAENGQSQHLNRAGSERSNERVSPQTVHESSVKVKEVTGKPLSLSFKEMPPASGTNLTTPVAEGNNPAPSAMGKPGMSAANGDRSTARIPEMNKNPTGPGSAAEEGDALRVSIDMEKTGKVIVTVLDSNGLIVRRLYQGVWVQGVHLLDWDGKDEAGNPVQPGNYTVAVNADGKTMTGTLTIRADR